MNLRSLYFGERIPVHEQEAVQKGFGSCGKQENLTLPVIEPRFSNHATCSQLTIMRPWLISNLMHKILVYLHIMHLLKPSTYFEHYPAHLQEDYVVIVYMQPLVYQRLHIYNG